MRLTRYGFAVGFISLAFCPTSARADLLITEPLSISATVPVLGTVDTSTFAAFNPALGTLVSMSWFLSGTTDYTGGGIPADEGGDLAMKPDPPSGACGDAYISCLFFPALGSGLPFSFISSSVTDPTVLSEYTGTGLRDFEVYDFGGNLTDHFALTGAGTVTFDYTPTQVPTPEPSSISLMLAVIGTIALRRSMGGPR